AAEEAGAAEADLEAVLRVVVELLDLLAVDVLVAGGAQDVDEPRAADLAGDHLDGEDELPQQRGELPRRRRVEVLLFGQVAPERDRNGHIRALRVGEPGPEPASRTALLFS